jgi:hypothetical protein
MATPRTALPRKRAMTALDRAGRTAGARRLPVLMVAFALAGAMVRAGAHVSPAHATLGGDPEPVYSVAAILGHLERDPAHWDGRTVRVRAVAGDRCITWMGGANPACISWQPALVDASVPATGVALGLRQVPPSPLLAALRRLPFAGRLLPGQQQIRWGMPSTYRVRLRAAPTLMCGQPACEALLDAAIDYP